MVFSKIISDLKNAIDDTDNKKFSNSYNKNTLNALTNQGRLYKLKKEQKINKFNKKKHLIENISNFRKGDEKIQTNLDKSKSTLENIEANYKKNLSDWGAIIKTFMDNYSLFLEKKRKCLEECQISFAETEQNRQLKINVCEIGCKLREPELQSLQDNEKQLDDKTPLICNVQDKCLNRNAKNDAAYNLLTDEEKIGCSLCGGGVGGKPIIKRSEYKKQKLKKNILSCDDVDIAFGMDSTQSLKEACNKGTNYFNNVISGNGYTIDGMKYKTNEQSYNFTNEYNNLMNLNNDLTVSAETLESGKIEMKKKSENILKQLLKYRKPRNLNKENFDTMEDLYDKYEQIYANLDKFDSNEEQSDKTTKAQIEDAELKLKSEKLQLVVWSGLAILTLLLVLKKINQ